MGTTFIYALCEPGTRTVRYIGKADKPKRRLNEHLKQSVKRNNHLGYWLRGLQSLDESPHLVILSEICVDRWQAEETRYIQAARMLGMRLVNATDGGEGCSLVGEKNPMFGRTGEKNPFFGKRHTPDTRAEISAKGSGERHSKFGKKESAETRTKKSVAMTPEKRAKLRADLSGENNPMFGKFGTAHPAFGNRHTSEARAKISNAKKTYWALKKASQL